MSDSSPPFSYVKGHSPFNIVAPRYTYEKLLHKIGMSDPDVTNFFLYILLFLRIISVCILHRQR